MSPGVQGVPLPKVAAHVTGVGLFTEPPTADGEDNLMKSRNKISSPLCGVSAIWNSVLEMITDMTCRQDMILAVYNHNAQVSAKTVLLHSQLCGTRGEECASRLLGLFLRPRMYARTCRCAAACQDVL